MNKSVNTKSYWVYPTRACNLDCLYCYQPKKKSGDHSNEEVDTAIFMNTETAEATVRFILSDEPNRTKNVQFFGGEPLLAWDIVQFFVDELKNSAGFSITTNGTLLNDEKLAYLKANNFSLALSLDGPPDVTRKTRPGSENVPIDTIAEYFPNAQIIITLSPENVEDAYPSTIWFIEKGFRNIAHNLALEKPWPKQAVDAHHEAFRRLGDLYIEQKGAIGYMFINFALKAVRNSGSTHPRNICGANPNLLSIDINGDIYPCQDMVTCDIEKKFRLGNVRNGYEKPQSISLTAIKFPDRGYCQKCWFFHQCVGGCGPKNLLVCGDRLKPIMNGCELYAIQTAEGMRALLNTGRLTLREKKGG